MALRLYLFLPFGQLHQNNTDVIAIAMSIGRTPSAVAMKACNFSSLDPALNRKGLGNASQSDRALWDAFTNNSEKISQETEDVFQKYVIVKPSAKSNLLPSVPDGDTEVTRTVRVRRVQNFFRRSVLISYNNRCALTGLDLPDLLIASHIIPWSVDKTRRADPTNGIALNALYDKLFDKGYIAFDENLNVILSKYLRYDLKENTGFQHVFEIEGLSLKLPSRFHPDISAIKYHRLNIFQNNR